MQPQKDFQKRCTHRANELKQELTDSLYQLRKKEYLTLQEMVFKTGGLLSMHSLERYELGRAGGLMPLEIAVIIATALGKKVKIVFENKKEVPAEG